MNMHLPATCDLGPHSTGPGYDPTNSMHTNPHHRDLQFMDYNGDGIDGIGHVFMLGIAIFMPSSIVFGVIFGLMMLLLI